MKLIDILVEELPKRGGWPKSAANATQDEDGEVCFSRCRVPDFGFASWNNGDWVSGAEFHTAKATDYAATIITREQYESALAAKNEGWIEWGGGECPVPRGTLVDVKYRCGDVNYHTKAGEPDSAGSIDTAFAVRWSKLGAEYDIIAYRLHNPQEATQYDEEADLNECIGQDVAPEWNGEGLPPVGCVCEYTMQTITGDDWNQCTVDYVGSSFVVYRDYCGVEISCSIGCIKFRPIRSEADKKRDAAVEDIDYWLPEFIADTPNELYHAKKIYDAIAAGKVRGVKLED